MGMITKLVSSGLRAAALMLVVATVFTLALSGNASAQSLPPTIAKSFTPSTIPVGGNSIATITVTNPNAFPINTVQFSDTMPAGIDLITQTGGTCSTPATGGGMFTINPGTETFSSTSSILAAGQSCTITVSVVGPIAGVFLNTTSPVTASQVPTGSTASATLTVLGPVVPIVLPALSPWQLGALASLLAMVAGWALRRRAARVTTRD
jgi:uncharacterized repeat protein (TIGR01451 family)